MLVLRLFFIVVFNLRFSGGKSNLRISKKISKNLSFFIGIKYLYSQNTISTMTQNIHIITLEEAETMTHAYQNATQFQGLTVACKIENFNLDLVTNQTGCVSTRFYFALNTENQLTLVIVGVDAIGHDMTDGIILERLYGCPLDCHFNSPLMI
jgi:hypothetical protein